jgi:hypothetical protein
MVPGASGQNPAFGIKLMRDGVPSGNIVLAESLGPNFVQDFFSPNFSTHPVTGFGEVCNETMARKVK